MPARDWSRRNFGLAAQEEGNLACAAAAARAAEDPQHLNPVDFLRRQAPSAKNDVNRAKHRKTHASTHHHNTKSTTKRVSPASIDSLRLLLRSYTPAAHHEPRQIDENLQFLLSPNCRLVLSCAEHKQHDSPSEISLIPELALGSTTPP